ncbi:uncharacterized protein NEMAJ01_1975 [Nematocida major]|uniref:uncharacterized protein n=1 Tax=Nematocida major TaxID=1912982 RepID=UPI002007E796|nr:uncharacterized protein NEMAJ01_1975 [Nematocida major]KAH9387079.1 hypothetical protein NEMAJ01_1975 [Nematocida major]
MMAQFMKKISGKPVIHSAVFCILAFLAHTSARMHEFTKVDSGIVRSGHPHPPYGTNSHVPQPQYGTRTDDVPPSNQQTPNGPPTKQKKRIMYYSNKINAGYLYSVGAQKYIGTDPNEYWLSAVESTSAPLLISIVPSYGNRIGSYMEIIDIKDKDHPQLGRKASNDFHYGAKRFDVGGGPHKNRCYLYGATSTYNRFVITPPYYKEGPAFKIIRNSSCLGIDSANNLMEVGCVDDTTDGYGTTENDMQLFEFHPVGCGDKCAEV